MCKTQQMPSVRDPVRIPLALTQLRELRRRGEPILPIKVPPHYRRLVERERALLGRTDGPLNSVVYPKSDKFTAFAPGEVVNFVEDYAHMPRGLERVIVHRYPGKLLFFPSQRCFGHCQYCFRPDVTADGAHGPPEDNLSDRTIEKVAAYLKLHPHVREVILSGGDPLVCETERLQRAVSRFLDVPSVQWCRLHTRAPVYEPSAVTGEVLDFLAGGRVRLVIHAVHPYEISPETVEVLEKVRRRGIAAFNQFPLLRGINDHPAAVMELAYRCAEHNVGMLSMFIADPIRYGAAYRLRLQRVFDIADEVFFRGEAWISNFRVCLDSRIGKVKREHIVSRDPGRDTYVFARQGRQVIYHDIPAEMDVPTPLADLLYNGAHYIDPGQWR